MSTHAELLLHVVDASHPDAVEDRSIVDVLRARHDSAVTVSAVTKDGFDRLAKIVTDELAVGTQSICIKRASRPTISSSAKPAMRNSNQSMKS